MLLRDVLILALAGTSLMLVPALVVRNATGRRLQPDLQTVLAAGSIVGLVCICLWIRSLGFGVDTATYADIFSGYCGGQSISDEPPSFILSVWLINAGMLGSCKVALLPGVWGMLMIVPLLAMREPLPLRLAYAALLLFSLVGVELTTNALRQGLSMGVCMLALSLWRRHWAFGLPFLLLAMSLHESTSLVLMLLGLALLPWPWFLACLVGAVGVVAVALQTDLSLSLIQPLLYEVTKYLAHESDELWVRVLAFSCVLLGLAAPWLARVRRDASLLAQREYHIALRLAVACVPFLELPYFGYRIMYGLYPPMLLFTLLAARRADVPLGRHFAWLLLLNAAVLVAWAQGSSAMREVAFFD